MIKLLMPCDYPVHSSGIFGGTSSAAYNLVQSLIKYTDINITIFSFCPRMKSNQFFSEENNRIRIYSFPANFTFRALIDYADKKYLFRKVLRRERPDIIHAQGEGLYASLAVNSHLPNVFTVHGVRLKEIEMERERLGRIRYFFRKRLIFSNHKKASNIVAINEYTKNEVAHLPNAKIWVIRNAVAETFFDLYKVESPETGNILLVGGIRKRKDIITAIKAIRNILEGNISVKLNIVGPIESDYNMKVDALINTYKIKGNVAIHGMVSATKLHELYLKSDLFLLTSIEESSPISIVEAMAAGKPIVATNVGGISEIVEESKNALLVGVKDHKGIAESIKMIITDRNMRESFSRESHKIASDAWSSKAVASDTYKMYVEVLHGK